MTENQGVVEVPVPDIKSGKQRAERLKGIQEWNPDLAGTIAVWEAKDGTRYIADGHQRTGLARRIMAGNPNMDIRIPAHIYREVDGITPRDARYYAAIKNIGEGTGSALDTAKVFKYGDKESLDYAISLSQNLPAWMVKLVPLRAKFDPTPPTN